MFQMLQEHYILLDKKYANKTSVKFGINIIDFHGINCNSHMEVKIKNNAFQFVITLYYYHIENMKKHFR